VSSLYETEPVADVRTDPGSQWFLNGVVRLETELAPHSLLEVCREVEAALGRDHDHRGGARTMDLDLLFYGARIIDEGGVVVPHPRLHLRRFVVVPLVELDPDWVHPVLGQTARTLLDGLADSPVVRRIDAAGSRYGSRPTCTSS
jgi:2-amino-4-hydroxy-6-hydroxymethyldihydropteridine diphosphokinase